MYQTTHEFEEMIQEKIANKELESALLLIKDLVEKIIKDGTDVVTIFGSNLLDKLCQQIGSQTLLKIKSQLEMDGQDYPPTNTVVYIVSELYLAGGHTAVLEDFIRYQPTKKHIVLMTDLFNCVNYEGIIERFANLPVAIEVASKDPSVVQSQTIMQSKLEWLQKRLYEIRPAKIFLFNHHQDAIAIAAIQPELAAEIFFYHHCDYLFCLGVYLSYPIHVDIHNMAFFTCRNKLRIKNNIYWPLIVPDGGVVNRNFQTQLTTCSSGSAAKFETPYLYQYSKLIPKILTITKGKHIHIGPLSENTIRAIHQGLKQHGIASDRFILLPWVKSVWQTLLKWKVDLYIASFPHGGGRTAIEVMGSGTPLVVHENYHSKLLGTQFLAYPEAFCWKKPDELMFFIANLTPTLLLKQGQLARHHYECYHCPEILTEELNTENPKGLVPLPLTEMQTDDLQMILDLFILKSPENIFSKRKALAFLFSALIKRCKYIVNKIIQPIRLTN